MKIDSQKERQDAESSLAVDKLQSKLQSILLSSLIGAAIGHGVALLVFMSGKTTVSTAKEGSVSLLGALGGLIVGLLISASIAYVSSRET